MIFLFELLFFIVFIQLLINYRKNNYHKKVTNLGTQAYHTVCSIRIQSNWRGHL